MKTLQKLIAEGLPVGALVKNKSGEIVQFTIDDSKKALINQMHQFLYPINKFDTALNKIAGFAYIPYLNLGTDDWQPTTAHDSNIDPETLPIPEPFWTGLVVWGGYKFEPIKYEKPSELFEDGWHQEFTKSECQPCLPQKH